MLAIWELDMGGVASAIGVVVMAFTAVFGVGKWVQHIKDAREQQREVDARNLVKINRIIQELDELKKGHAELSGIYTQIALLSRDVEWLVKEYDANRGGGKGPGQGPAG